MIQLRANLPDLPKRVRALKGWHKKVTIMSARRLRYWGDQIISGIRRDRTLFSYKIPRLATQRRRGALKASLWRGRPMRDNEGVKVQLGAGVPYDTVLEHGPTKKVWKIRPSGFRAASGRSGGQTGIQFLRFRGGDRKIHYAKEVTRRWKQSELRPHWEPHTEFRVKMMARDIAKHAAELV